MAKGDTMITYTVQPASYTLLVDSTTDPEAKAGSEVFIFRGHDYGCSRDDSIAAGKPHIAVTRNVGGEGPFFTVALEDLE
jgi:hypothetical protein